MRKRCLLHTFYDATCRVIGNWCTAIEEVPFQCSVGIVLSFHQTLPDKEKAFSPIKVYIAAISACPVGLNNKTEKACGLRVKTIISWKGFGVGGFIGPPFEPGGRCIHSEIPHSCHHRTRVTVVT